MAKKNRFEYLKDFVADEHGKYVYVGTTYTLDPGESGKNRFQILGIPALLSGAAFLFSILTGIIPAPHMNGHAAVILSYAAALIGSALTAICAFRILFTRDPVRDYTYKETVEKLVPNAWIAVIGFGISVPAYIYFVIRYGMCSPEWASVLFIVFQLLGGISSYLTVFWGGKICYKAHPGKKQEENTKDPELPDPDEYRVV